MSVTDTPYTLNTIQILGAIMPTVPQRNVKKILCADVYRTFLNSTSVCVTFTFLPTKSTHRLHERLGPNQWYSRCAGMGDTSILHQAIDFSNYVTHLFYSRFLHIFTCVIQGVKMAILMTVFNIPTLLLIKPHRYLQYLRRSTV